MDAFSAEADRELAASLRAIRKKLGLKQVEAGRLFGGGINAFSEYGRGKTQPHKSTVLLLNLLHKHPELLQEQRNRKEGYEAASLDQGSTAQTGAGDAPAGGEDSASAGRVKRRWHWMGPGAY